MGRQVKKWWPFTTKKECESRLSRARVYRSGELVDLCEKRKKLNERLREIIGKLTTYKYTRHPPTKTYMIVLTFDEEMIRQTYVPYCDDVEMIRHIAVQMARQLEIQMCTIRFSQFKVVEEEPKTMAKFGEGNDHPRI